MTKDVTGQEISLVSDYAKNPILRALVRLIPAGIGSAGDVLIMERAERIKRERIRTFFDELAIGKLTLTQQLVESDDFLHSLDATLRAALHTRRNNKIRMFARLLQRGAVEGLAKSTDDYEELVALLDELSYREWEALILFDAYLDCQPENENPLARVNPFWLQFVSELEAQLGVPAEEASSFMIRIGRTGLFGEITGGYMDYGGGVGITTPKFARFRALVRDHKPALDEVPFE